MRENQIEAEKESEGNEIEKKGIINNNRRSIRCSTTEKKWQWQAYWIRDKKRYDCQNDTFRLIVGFWYWIWKGQINIYHSIWSIFKYDTNI